MKWPRKHCFQPHNSVQDLPCTVEMLVGRQVFAPTMVLETLSERGLSVGDLDMGSCYRDRKREVVTCHDAGLILLGWGQEACGPEPGSAHLRDLAQVTSLLITASVSLSVSGHNHICLGNFCGLLLVLKVEGDFQIVKC